MKRKLQPLLDGSFHIREGATIPLFLFGQVRVMGSPKRSVVGPHTERTNRMSSIRYTGFDPRFQAHNQGPNHSLRYGIGQRTHKEHLPHV